MNKFIDAFAYFKVCATRVNAFFNLVNTFLLLTVLFKSLGIPLKWLPVGIIFEILSILVIGTLDIRLGLWRKEVEIGHLQSPILMEILEIVRGRKGNAI